MKKNRPLIELSEKEFLEFFKWGNRIWWQLTYRIKWLIRKAKDIWLKVYIKKNNWRYIAWIHQKYLAWRQVQNPFLKENSLIVWKNCILNKDKYIENDDRINNIQRMKNSAWYIEYYFTSEIKTFIFSLIKKYYHDNK